MLHALRRMLLVDLWMIVAAAMAILSAEPRRCEAGTVSYDFVNPPGYKPVKLGARLDFESPPAYPDRGWTGHAGLLEITNPSLGPVGQYALGGSVISGNGSTLDAGELLGDFSSTQNSTISITAPFGGGGGMIDNMNIAIYQGQVVVGDFIDHGLWGLASPAPEPSTLVLGGLGAAIVLGYGRRRRAGGRGLGIETSG